MRTPRKSAGGNFFREKATFCEDEQLVGQMINGDEECLLLYAGFVQASKPGFSVRLVYSIWPRLRIRNFKKRKRREDVIPGKPEAQILSW